MDDIRQQSMLSMSQTWHRGAWELRSNRVVLLAKIPAYVKGRAVEPWRAISQRKGRLYAVLPRHRMLRLKFKLASSTGNSSASTCLHNTTAETDRGQPGVPYQSV